MLGRDVLGPWGPGAEEQWLDCMRAAGRVMLGFTHGVEGWEQAPRLTAEGALIGSVELSVTLSHEEQESIELCHSTATKEHVECTRKYNADTSRTHL